jgi:hypothetical protein
MSSVMLKSILYHGREIRKVYYHHAFIFAFPKMLANITLAYTPRAINEHGAGAVAFVFPFEQFPVDFTLEYHVDGYSFLSPLHDS